MEGRERLANNLAIARIRVATMGTIPEFKIAMSSISKMRLKRMMEAHILYEMFHKWSRRYNPKNNFNLSLADIAAVMECQSVQTCGNLRNNAVVACKKFKRNRTFVENKIAVIQNALDNFHSTGQTPIEKNRYIVLLWKNVVGDMDKSVSLQRSYEIWKTDKKSYVQFFDSMDAATEAFLASDIASKHVGIVVNVFDNDSMITIENE